MNLTLQNQLRLMSLVTALLLGGIIALSMLNLRSLQQEFFDYQRNRDTDQTLIEIKAAALSVARVDPILAETEPRMNTIDARIRALFAEVVHDLAGSKHEAAVQAALELWNGYAQGIAGAIRIAADSPMDALSIPDAMYQMKLAPMVEKLDALSETFKQSDKQARERFVATTGRIVQVVLWPLVLVAGAVVAFQLLFSRALHRRLAGMAEVVGKLRAGDLRQRLPIGSQRDEISRLSEVVNAFIDHFVTVLSDVQQAVVTTEATVRNVEELSHKAHANAEAQSDRFYEVSSAIEQISQTLTDMVRTVESASASANETRAIVGRGNDTGDHTVSALNRIDQGVSDATQTLDELETAIERVGNVSNIIREIAEQTNLLALNAAIEAARAGEHGRGFAVVADEVRTLANRTATSITDIADIIASIQQNTLRASTAMNRAREEVRDGVSHGEAMVHLLADIDRSAQQMAEMMHTIAAATEQQSATGNEIARNVQAVFDITTANKRDSEASRGAVGDLVAVANRLSGAVDRFQM